MSSNSSSIRERAPEEPATCPIEGTPPPMERRSFLVWLASIGLAASGLFTGATVAQALMPPARSIDGKTKVGTLSVGRLSDLQVGKPVLVEYGDDALFLIKKSTNDVAVLSQTCPHVGCKVAFNAATMNFDCPCHASSFSIDGKRLGGPAPRGLYEAAFEVVDGEIRVSGIKV